MATRDFYKNKELFLKGGGEMGRLIREKDWSETPIGNPASWPPSLRTMVSVMLENPFGMYIAWGKEFTQIYNDGYRPILGTEKHPKALGTSTSETFAEIFEIVEPIFNDVLNGQAVSISDFKLQLNRNGYIEDCFFDVSYSPIRQEDGTVGGILTTILETTNKKRAIENLKESESRFRTMAENTDILIAISNENGDSTFFNKAWLDLTGKTIEELIKDDWLNLVHPEDQERFTKIYSEAISKRSSFQVEYRILSWKGNYRWLLSQCPPRFRSDGSFAGYISSCTDITDRKIAEKELKDNKDQLQFAIDATDLATFDFNPVTNTLSANNRLKKWFNLSRAEDIDLQEALQSVAEKDKEMVQNAIRDALNYNSGGMYDIKYAIKNPVNEKEIIVHAKGKTFFDENRIAYRLNGTLQDITDETLAQRKIAENEEIIKSIVKSSPAGICVINSSTLISEMANDTFLQFMNIKLEDVIGKNYWDCFPSARQRFEAELKKVIDTGIPYFAHEEEFLQETNGKMEKVYSTFVFAPIKNEEGDILKVAIWAMDNTQQIRVRKLIEEREQEIRAFVESAPFPIGVYTGKEMRIVVANQSIMDAWGKGKDVIGKLYSEILPELENQDVFKQLEDVFITGIPFHTKDERVNLVKEGELTPYYFNYSLTPLFDAEGNIYGVMNTAADVTELNEAKQKVEAALEELKLYKHMSDNAADPFILMDREGNFAYMNSRGTTTLGYSQEEIKKIKVPDIDPLFDIIKFKKLFDQNQVSNIATFETIHKKKNGDTYPVEINIGKVEFQDVKYMFALPRDISERKKAEQDLMVAFHKIEDSEKRFRNSVEQAPLGIAIFRGSDFIVELANEAYLAIIQDDRNSLIGQPFFVVHPELEDVISPLFKQVVRTGEPFFGNEFPAILSRADGLELTYFNLVYHPLKEECGEISGIMVVAIEVTANVKAKHLLEESETNFRNLVISSPIGMTLLKTDNFVVDIANKVMLEFIWKKTGEEVIGKSIFEIFPELIHQKYPDILNKVYKTGITHTEKEAIFYFKRKNKTQKIFLDYEYAPFYDGDGKISGIMVTGNDVTDKVEARRKVEDAEERLRLATEATGISTWDLDLENKNIIHSRRLAVIFGYPESTLLSHEEIRQHIHSDDAHLRDIALSKALISGNYNYEARIIKTDKSIAWIRAQGKVFFDDQQHPVKVLGTLRDITDDRNHQKSLEESESKFRLLANALAQQVWLSDPEGNLYYFNQTVHDFSGLNNEQLKDYGWQDILHADEKEEDLKVWQKSIMTGKEFLVEHRLRRFDGEYRWQLSKALPQKDAAGNIQMWVGSSTDIQEIKEQEQQKDLFISIASHELKTPLTSIKGYVQILQSMKTSVESSFLEKALGIIDKQVNKLTQLIAELLDVSKIKSGGLDFEKEEFEMTELIEEVVTEIRHINPQIEIPVETSERIMVYADRNRIGQVLINFLNNAIKYSPNSMLVKVSCFLSENGVKVSVEDSGIGIAKRVQEKIFKRFYRVEGKNETTFPGFGIGLFISADIISRHNGNIHLDSEPGKGSTFTFEIPLK